jgi:sugar lactone lactonase YvrE
MKPINIFISAAFLAAVIIVPVTHAVVTQKVTDDTFAAFSGGEFENISLANDGRMELAPSITNLATATDPIIWAVVEDKKGNIYFGTGNEGKVYKLTPKGDLTTFFEPNAVMVHALAVDDHDRLYAATSPNGCVYRLDSDGRAEVFCNPGETYIWAMTFDHDGSLFLATGDHGKVLRVPTSHSTPAEAETYFETKEANITALALDNNGDLLAGSSPHGYLYRIDKAGHGFVVFNSITKEIKQLAVAPDGVIYAATFVSNGKADESGGDGSITIDVSPTEAETMSTAKTATKSVSKHSVTTSDDDNSDAVISLGDVASLASLVDGSESDSTPKETGAIYRVDTNGFCDRYWSIPGETIYSMALLPDGTLLAGTGDKGRIYSISDANHWKLLQETSDGAQLAALWPDVREPARFYAATSHPAQIFRLDLSLAEKGTFTSKAFDAKQKSQWGKFHPLGEVPTGAKLEISTRSGNTPKPEKTWSDWSKPEPLGAEISATSPNARYLQYRVEFQHEAGSPGATACLRRMEFYYQNLNAPPVISRVKVHNEGFSLSKMPMPQQMGGGAAGIGQLLDDDAGSSKSGGGRAEAMMAAMMAQAPMQTIEKPGYCTVVWEAKDPNDDKLVYSVSIRAESGTDWTTLVDKTDDSFYSFNTTGFGEGLYVIKVTASDLPSNTPETALMAEAVSEPFLINNTPPVLTAQSQAVERDHARIVVNATDAASVIDSASYSLDGKDEVALRPDDLIFDSTNETFTIALNGLAKGTHSLLVHATDEAKNAAVLQLNFECK